MSEFNHDKDAATHFERIAVYAFGEAKTVTLHLYSGATGNLIRSIQSPGDGTSDYFGFKTAKVDDKDGDGKVDFWVAAPMWGTVYLMNG